MLPESIRDRHDHVTIGRDIVDNSTSVKSAHAYASLGVDNSFSLSSFQSSLQIRVRSQESKYERSMEFDLIGVDASFANALRRIVMSEVPTFAIERVYIKKNSSVIPDEILAHRLGLLPLNIPITEKHIAQSIALYEKRNRSESAAETGEAGEVTIKVEDEEGEGEAEETEVYRFALSKKCPDRAVLKSLYNASAGPKEKVDFGSEAINKVLNAKSHQSKDYVTVLSKDLVRSDVGENDMDVDDRGGELMDKDIVIVLLGPGQELELEVEAELGIGRDHAKWSPVATASYRLLPKVTIKEPVYDEHARKLKDMCPKNVFDLEDISPPSSPHAVKLVVGNQYECTMCRECIRDTADASHVLLQRVRNHFIFSVESISPSSPPQLVLYSSLILRQKALNLLNILNTL